MGLFHGRNAAVRIAEISIVLSIDSNQAVQLLRDARPCSLGRRSADPTSTRY